ncbi:hypothetical protein Y032_0061g3252 [Ancylostoma ceylanicum]|uniref:Uncharacterized protein n=1 Tax=Ancylostoma ceylanicum TaxID=53326 RepID=A0A016U3S6_9BILA|nr:hypothetical protein Y032_0061g3252 [Ancylostoma ceylanicum]
MGVLPTEENTNYRPHNFEVAEMLLNKNVRERYDNKKDTTIKKRKAIEKNRKIKRGDIIRFASDFKLITFPKSGDG